ncbi:MAG: HAMP domain-containing histidine kinase [Pedobacter sp.]|nr:MAG: HAMP domain-containing histidine kinase [Pedobacter sp.]
MRNNLNISFIYDVKTGQFTFLDEFLGSFLTLERTYSAADLLNYVFNDDVNLAKRYISEFNDGILQGNMNLRLWMHDQPVWIRVTPIMYTDETGKRVFGNVVDTNAEMTNVSTITKYTNKKNSILHMLSHDLRGPLNIAKSLTDALNKQLNDTELNKKANAITDILDQTILLINSLTHREFIDTLEIELVLKRTDLALRLAEYLEECSRSEDEAQRKFKFITSHKSIYLALDEAKFMQIINNLMSNALKFTEAGDEITIELIESTTEVTILFSDNGIGIPKDLIPHIFTKFTKAGRTGLHGEPSMGLGLSIVKTIIEWHKGSILVESKEGVGTTFKVVIPKLRPEC